MGAFNQLPKEQGVTMKKLILATVLVLLAAYPLLAQIDFPKPNLNPFKGSSLLKSNKLSMSHSMGFEAGTASGGNGYYLSRYTNHIAYSFNSKLKLDLDLNFINFGSASTARGISFNQDNSSRILPEFSLNYKPSDSVSFELHYRQAPSSLYQYSNRPWAAMWGQE